MLADGGTGELTIRGNARVSVYHWMKIRTGGTLNIQGGELVLRHGDPIELGGGTVNFAYGTVQFDGDVTAAAGGSLCALLGAAPVVAAGQNVDVSGDLALQMPLTVDGGSLIATSISLDGGSLTLSSGALSVTGTGINVGSTGLLDHAIVLDFGSSVATAGTLSVAREGLVVMRGGRLSGATISNTGRIVMDATTGWLQGNTFTNAGGLRGTGLVVAPLANLAGGRVVVHAGDRMHFALTANTNEGAMELLGGTFEFEEDLTNAAGGDILGRGALHVRGGLTNLGDLGLSNGVTDVRGDVANAPGGKVMISGRADVTFWDDVDHSGAVFRVSEGSSVTFYGAYSGGTITGGGHVYFEDDVTPGFSPSAVGIGGDVTFGVSSRLEIEIEGPTPGAEHDQLNVTGSAELDGQLDVVLSGHLPMPHDTFTIMTFASRDGEFASATGLDDLGGYLGLDFDVVYSPTSVILEATALDGDATLDATVNVFDLAALANNYRSGTDKTWFDGDFTGDGEVDIFDLARLANNYGKTKTGGQPIPEPMAMAVLALGGLGLLRKRPKRVADTE